MTPSEIMNFYQGLLGKSQAVVEASVTALAPADQQQVAEFGTDFYLALQHALPQEFGIPALVLTWDEAVANALQIDQRRATLNADTIKAAAQEMTERLKVKNWWAGVWFALCILMACRP